MTTDRDKQPRRQGLDLPQLRTFVTVVDQLNFSAASRRLGLSQSAVSQHVRRLEGTLGVVLLARDTHRVALTAEGEALTAIARSMLELNDEAFASIGTAVARGRVRFGVSEDFALSRLPELLRRFGDVHPAIDLELTVGLSVHLHRRLRARELDLVLAKRSTDSPQARLVFADRLVWVGSPDLRLDRSRPVPLITYPPPSVTRDRAVQALEQTARGYHTACTSGSLSGLRAAALAGLGVLPFARSLTPEGLVEVGQRELPRLGSTDFVLVTRRSSVPPATQAVIDSVLADHRELYAAAPSTEAQGSA